MRAVAARASRLFQRRLPSSSGLLPDPCPCGEADLPLSSGLTDYALELFAGVGHVEARRMFGGAGLFRDRVMLVLRDDVIISARVADARREQLQAQGYAPWKHSMERDCVARDMRLWCLLETV